MRREDWDDTAPYIEPRRMVALCYQPSFSSADQPPSLSPHCRRIALDGSAGGLVVLDPSPAHLLPAVLGLAGADSNAERPTVPVSPAAAYPPRYSGLRVRVLCTSSDSHQRLQQLLSSHAFPSSSQSPTPSPAGQILAPPDLLPLTPASELGLVQLVQRVLDASIDPPEATNADNVFLFHIEDSALHPSLTADDSSLFFPSALDNAVGQLLTLFYGESQAASSPYADVYLALVRLQAVPHTPRVTPESPLFSLIPRQSYQLAIPSASSSSPLYLPLLSFHPSTTRSDRALHAAAPSSFTVGSGGLIAARDWLAEVAFKLGGKAKYGA